MKDRTSSKEKILESLENSKVSEVNVVSEIKQSFLDYAMSVITSRALPDFKDGLKPVHRRIIFAAHQEGLYNNKKFKKSAALVGTVMGSYHPHGDMSIYDALVRMSQDFNMRYPLIEGQGNFGSIDGDAAAAMRYTEVKLSKIGEYFLDGIKENCVEFMPNYDGTKEEPKVLPTLIPNILLNGSTGIAVGLATSIPPHNLVEVCDAIKAIIKNPNLDHKELRSYLKGPDFPTGGEILNYNGVESYFETGSGTFYLRSKVEIEEHPKKNLLIIKEIPYGVKKTNLIEKIVSLIKPSKNQGETNLLLSQNIVNISDESNLEGIRLIIEVKKEVNPKIILNNLYKFTPLQEAYAPNLTILVDQRPQLLSILQILKLYLEHQIEMLVRRTKFNLLKINNYLHILEGRSIISKNILEVVKLISSSDSPEEELQSRYLLSPEQLKDILSMQLRSIKKIEQGKLLEELEAQKVLKIEHEKILADPEYQKKLLLDKIKEIKDKFGDERRTKINFSSRGKIFNEDLISDQKVVITLSEKGYISQLSLKTFKLHRRGGVGTKGSSIYEDDNVKMLLTAFPIDDIFIFTDKGKVYKLKAHQLGFSSNKNSKGVNLSNFLSYLDKNEKVVTILSLSDEDHKRNLSLIFATKDGIVKKNKLELFKSVRSNGKIAFKLKGDDELKFVIKVDDNSQILLSSSAGKVVKFLASELRNLGRATWGVRGLKLTGKENTLVSASSSFDGDYVFSIGNKGFGKITRLDSFRLTNRGCTGVIGLKINKKTGPLLACVVVKKEDEILLMTNKNRINRFKILDVSEYSRVTSGVTLFKLEPSEKIVYFTKNSIEVQDLTSDKKELS